MAMAVPVQMTCSRGSSLLGRLVVKSSSCRATSSLACGFRPEQGERYLAEVVAGVIQARDELLVGARELPGFAEVGNRMVDEWDKGLLSVERKPRRNLPTPSRMGEE